MTAYLQAWPCYQLAEGRLHRRGDLVTLLHDSQLLAIARLARQSAVLLTSQYSAMARPMQRKETICLEPPCHRVMKPAISNLSLLKPAIKAAIHAALHGMTAAVKLNVIA